MSRIPSRVATPLSFLIVCVLWGCTSHELVAPNRRPEQQTDDYFISTPNRDVDILFMIDDSGSMKEEQDNLRRNFPAFIDELRNIPGGTPNVQIGIVSSNMGAGGQPLANVNCPPGGHRGIFRAKAGCGLDTGAQFIVARDGERSNNYTGDLAEVFSCLAELGIEGCGLEHQLQATRTALNETLTPQNRGFLRPDAYLAIILLTDEDDCSAPESSDLFDLSRFPGEEASLRCARFGHVCQGKTPPSATYSVPLAECKAAENGPLIDVQEFVDSIRGLKKDPNKIVVSGIFGWPGNAQGLYRVGLNASNKLDYLPGCEQGKETATSAIRMKQFVDAFDPAGFFSICQPDFRPAMKAIGAKVADVISRFCIGARLVDTDPVKTGMQADCQVSDLVPPATGVKPDTPLASCAANGNRAPCWDLAADDVCKRSGFKVTVNRGGQPAPQGGQLSVKCATCADGDPRCR
jgi:hypothetical protein